MAERYIEQIARRNSLEEKTSVRLFSPIARVEAMSTPGRLR